MIDKLKPCPFCGGTKLKLTKKRTKYSEILKLTKYEPLFGHKSGKLNKTHWLCFMKAGEQND